MSRDKAAAEAAQLLISAQQRMIVSLLEAIEVHAIRSDKADYTRFQTDLKTLRESIGSLTSGEEMDKAAAAALRSMQEHNLKTAASIQGQGRELHKITSMLTETIVQLSSAGNNNVSALQDIEKQIETTSRVDDILKLKERLSECLLSIREEKVRQQQTSNATVSALSYALKSGSDSRKMTTDPLTGLGSRPDAEMAIASALDQRRSCFVAFFVIEHLHSLNQRFGRQVGDELIMMFSVHLIQHLRPVDLVFHWSGPAFLVVLDRDYGPERVRRELSPLLRTRLEKTLDINNRTVLLPINFTWILLPGAEYTHACHLVDKVDSFMRAQAGGDN